MAETSKQSITLALYWGIMADPISKQLKDKGYNLPEDILKHLDQIKEAFNLLYYNCLTTDRQHKAIRKKCNNYVKKEVKKWLKEQKISSCIDTIKCPHCGTISDVCNFPDLFCSDESMKDYRKQYKLLRELQTKGFNIVTCGFCGLVFIAKTKEQK